MIVIGTAGHIDHGKTTLTEALTGVRTDRLQQEIERGISIELGFAYLDLPDGQRCAVIDVPGHERFVRHMIAGAAGVDVVLLVIAADEGVMPQTREHLDICRLLGVREGVVVLSKVDLVDAEWRELVQADLREVLVGSFLEDAPVLAFSSEQPEVAAAFRQELFAWLQARGPGARRRDPDRPLRMGVDRSFTIRGFGTVVTGTVAAGTLRVGDEVELLPSGRRSRVRGIQVHGAKMDAVTAGHRAAVNLQGLDRDDAPRGAVLTAAGALAATSMFDATLHVLPHIERAVGARAKALVHVGTAQIQGTLIPLDRREVTPGEDALVQVRLDHPTVVAAGEPFVLRGFDARAHHGKTIGGGLVLDPRPRRHRALRPEVLHTLHTLRDGALDERLIALVALGGGRGLELGEAVARADAGRAEVEQAAEEAVREGRLISVPGDPPLLVERDAYTALIERLDGEVAEWHRRYPWRAGIASEALRGRVKPPVEPRLFAKLAADQTESGAWAREGELVRHASFAPRLEGEVLAAHETLAQLYRRAALEPPLLAEALAASPAPETTTREAIDVLVRQGRLCRVKPDLLFDREALGALQGKLVAFLEAEGSINTSQFKELTGLSRKFSIPLGEWFDAQKVTVRVDDTTRTLRPKLS